MGAPNNCEYSCTVKGAPRSCTVHGVMLENGTSVARDAKRANEFYLRGCVLGDAEGCHLGGLQMYLGKGVPPNRDFAARMFSAACQLSLADGCAMLGAVRASVPGVPPLEVQEHLVRACRLGSGLGCLMLGQRTLTGNGVAKDPIEAKKLFHLACVNGEPEGCKLEKDTAPVDSTL